MFALLLSLLCVKIDAYDFAVGFSSFGANACSGAPTIGGTNKVSCIVDPTGGSKMSYKVDCSSGTGITLTAYNSQNCTDASPEVLIGPIGGCYTSDKAKNAGGQTVAVFCHFNGTLAGAAYGRSTVHVGGLPGCRSTRVPLLPEANTDCSSPNITTFPKAKLICPINPSNQNQYQTFGASDATCATPQTTKFNNYALCVTATYTLQVTCSSATSYTFKTKCTGASSNGATTDCLLDSNGVNFQVACTGSNSDFTISYYSDSACTTSAVYTSQAYSSSTCATITPPELQPYYLLTCPPLDDQYVVGPGVVTLVPISITITDKVVTSNAAIPYAFSFKANIHPAGLGVTPTLHDNEFTITKNGVAITCANTPIYNASSGNVTCKLNLIPGYYVFLVFYKGSIPIRYDVSNILTFVANFDVNACVTVPCGVNTACRDSKPPALGDVSGRVCICDSLTTGDPNQGCWAATDITVTSTVTVGGKLFVPVDRALPVGIQITTKIPATGHLKLEYRIKNQKTGVFGPWILQKASIPYNKQGVGSVTFASPDSIIGDVQLRFTLAADTKHKELIKVYNAVVFLFPTDRAYFVQLAKAGTGKIVTYFAAQPATWNNANGGISSLPTFRGRTFPSGMRYKCGPRVWAPTNDNSTALGALPIYVGVHAVTVVSTAQVNTQKIVVVNVNGLAAGQGKVVAAFCPP